VVGGSLTGCCTIQAEWFELGEMPCCDDYSVQQLCQHNQYLAVRNRVVPDWGVGDDGLRHLRPIAKALGGWLGKRVKLSPNDWLDQYSGAKREQYLKALATLDTQRLRKRDSYVKAFVKAEKVTDPMKDPRMIQYRGPRYNIELGNYLKAFEHDLYHMRGSRRLNQWFPNERLIVKGMAPAARAAHIEKMWYQLKKPVQLALDCSRFDGHCTEKALMLEHSVYLSCFNNDSHLQRLLRWQRDNKCFTKDGVVYKVKGNRMSGDMNTALGNCVLMILMLGGALRELGVKPSQFRLADDGDDCCLLVEEEVAQRVIDGITRVFSTYGHSLKVDQVNRQLETVDLCGCRPIRVGGVRKMILNPRRTIGKSRLMLKYRGVKFQRDYIATVGECLLALHSGVPVVQSHAAALMRVGSQLKYRPRSWAYKLAHSPEPSAVASITADARLDFYLAFGVNVDDQLSLERWYDSATPDQILGYAPALRCSR